MTLTLKAGFLPLTDAAPLIVAREMGFAAEEDLELDLVKLPSWSVMRDYLMLGMIDAAHLLSPVPVAKALGLSGPEGRIDAIAAMNTGGNVIGVSAAIAEEMRAAGHRFDFADARAAGEALLALGRPLRVGVPFPFSMHAELLYYWLERCGLSDPAMLAVNTVPPPLMADALAAGEIDAFCVGEPWGSLSVENGVGTLLLPTSAIRRSAIEKVLAVRGGWADDNSDLAGRLLRALWRAGTWLDRPLKRATAAEIMSRPEYLDLPVNLIERGLNGSFVISEMGEVRQDPHFLTFQEGAVGFPWRSQASWIAMRIAKRLGLEEASAIKTGKSCFRTDIYRKHLRELGADLPGASEKLEGAISQPTAVPSERGRVILSPDHFFDGQVFDPES
ncbi:ABC transporter substrate-binding protein [Thioclava sp. GXIMD4216]|uniref:ABC transporter substrate-binding protein n=1 Tax=unclassified Thioclava TaxID=2621713 RepID=UPI0030D46BAA